MIDLLIDYAALLAAGMSGATGSPPPDYTDPDNFPTYDLGASGATGPSDYTDPENFPTDDLCDAAASGPAPDYTDPGDFPTGDLGDLLDNPTEPPPPYDPMDYAATGPDYLDDYYDYMY
jgi:hypothetical protein